MGEMRNTQFFSLENTKGSSEDLGVDGKLI